MDTIAQIVSSKSQVLVCVQKRIGGPSDVFGRMIPAYIVHRCARNCFLCPNCRNTLSVVPSDPPEDDTHSSAAPLGTIN